MVRHGTEGFGALDYGTARFGKVWQLRRGKFWFGGVRRGMVRQLGCGRVRYVTVSCAWAVAVRRGRIGCVWVRLGS